MNIPFNKLHLTGNEIMYMKQALDAGSISGDGYFNNKVCTLLEDRLKGSKIITTTSGTHALEMAMLLFDIKEGDEVIMPSYTFPSTANAVMLYGGTPIFVDIDKNTLTMDLEEVERKITEHTKVIMPVHYGGAGCQMDKIMNLSQKYNLHIVEDAAQALGTTYKGKPLGTWGHIGCFSFHATKNYVSGEGGALAINTKDNAILKRVEIIRQKGTNRNQFMRGEISQYTWVDIGSSYAPSDILMALLYPQLINIDNIIKKRKWITGEYIKHLKIYLDKKIICSMTSIPKDFESNYHNFYILLRNKKERKYIIDRLNEYNIQAYIHFVPLHNSPKGLTLGYKEGDLPKTEKVSNTLLRLPMYTDMNMKELNYILEKLSLVLEELF